MRYHKCLRKDLLDVVILGQGTKKVKKVPPKVHTHNIHMVASLGLEPMSSLPVTKPNYPGGSNQKTFET